MQDQQLVTFAQLESFVSAARGMRFVGKGRKEKYAWIERLLQRFFYASARKKNKTIVKRYARKMTGYSDAQMTRLITRYCRTRRLCPPSSARRARFPQRYTPSDVAALIETDAAHARLSGPATRAIFRRAYELFCDTRFLRLKDISVSHLYNLRGTRQYRSHASFFAKTASVRTDIGARRKPRPEGKPGFIRVDSVHQGDQDREKGVYHINLVDEVTQWEIVACVEGITDQFLLPALAEALRGFPFVIHGFHSDNGSEYINHQVAALLNQLLVAQTKSRPRHSNDNALAESKNGSVIRKHMGYAHIPKQFAPRIHAFYQTHLNPYVNYHRPSGYARTVTDQRGKQKKIYDTYETPYAHLKKMPDAASFLRPDVSFAELDAIASAHDDNTCAILMQKAKTALFKSFSA